MPFLIQTFYQDKITGRCKTLSNSFTDFTAAVTLRQSSLYKNSRQLFELTAVWTIQTVFGN
jgi:hypothetical protein